MPWLPIFLRERRVRQCRVQWRQGRAVRCQTKELKWETAIQMLYMQAGVSVTNHGGETLQVDNDFGVRERWNLGAQFGERVVKLDF